MYVSIVLTRYLHVNNLSFGQWKIDVTGRESNDYVLFVSTTNTGRISAQVPQIIDVLPVDRNIIHLLMAQIQSLHQNQIHHVDTLWLLKPNNSISVIFRIALV